ncbi:MAG: hypothetical protein AAGM67_05035 [Bacteroidota bacterium]
MLSTIGLAMLIAGGVYMTDVKQSAQVQLIWPEEPTELGQSIRLELLITDLIPEYRKSADLYFHLPNDLEAHFVPSSLKVLQGSLKEATVLPYSGRKRLQIQDVSLDSLRLAIEVQLSEDLGFAERSFQPIYGLMVNQRAFPQQSEQDHFHLGHHAVSLTHRLLRSNRRQARYELWIKNPPEGATYNLKNGLLSLMIQANDPAAQFQNLRVQGQNLDIQDNILHLEDLSLQPGAAILVQYDLAFSEGANPAQNLLSVARLEVPGSQQLRQEASVVIEKKAVRWAGFEAQMQGDSLQLHWRTRQETNNKGFWVERSRNGQRFESLAFVEGSGTVARAQEYAYWLDSLAAGCYYFRLRQESLSGKQQYSETLAFSYRADEAYAFLFDESAQTAKLQLAIPQQLRVEIRNRLGETVAVVFDGMMEADVPYQLDVSMSEFSEGDYLFWLEGEYFQSRRWFIRRLGKWRRFAK